MYKGYLIKVGDYEIPQEFITASSFKVTRNVMEANAYRDANGRLHRNTLSHVPIKVVFQTPDGLSNTDAQAVLSEIRSRYTNALERKCTIDCYVPETDEYVSQETYQPDIEMTIDRTEGPEIYYSSIKLTFIGY